MTIHSIKKQQGAALVVGLVLLTIITLMGYAGMKSTILQEKMAAGLHNRSLAMAGANSAVRAGESFLYNLIDFTNSVVVDGTPSGSLFNVYSELSDPNNPASAVNPTVELFKERNWTSTAGTVHAHDFTASSHNGSLKTRPQYIIEELALKIVPPSGETFGSGGSNSTRQKAFLITGKSQSGDGNTIALVQSMFTVVTDSSASN